MLSSVALKRKANDWVHHQGKLIAALAKVNLTEYDRSRKAYFDRLIKERMFEVGDVVKMCTKSLGDLPSSRNLRANGLAHTPSLLNSTMVTM